MVAPSFVLPCLVGTGVNSSILLPSFCLVVWGIGLIYYSIPTGDCKPGGMINTAQKTMPLICFLANQALYIGYMAQVITVPLFPFLPFHYSIFLNRMGDMIKMFLSCPPRRVSGNAPGEHLFYSELTPFKNSVILTDAVGQDLPVAGFKGIAVVMFQTIPFWSTPRPPVVRLPFALFLAVNVPGANRMTISRLSLPMVLTPCALTGASVTGAT